MLEKVFNSNNISNLITILSVCIGGYITYVFNNISEKKKIKKEQNREAYKLIRKNCYCIKKTLRNILEVGSNEKECVEYAKQYNLMAQKVLKDYRTRHPNVNFRIAIGFQDELCSIERPIVIPKYEFVYLDEMFNICIKDKESSYIAKSNGELSTDYYLFDFFSLKILSTLLPYNEFIEFKKVVDLENLNKYKFYLYKCFNKKKFTFYKELKDISDLIDKQILYIKKSINELNKLLCKQNWIKEKKSEYYVLEDFDSEKFISLYRKNYDDFFSLIIDLTNMVNKLLKIYYKYFYYI